MLNRFVSIYIPGTKNVNERLTVKSQNVYARAAAAKLSSKFGGATSTNAQGYYVSDNGILIHERIIIVKSYHETPGPDALQFAESIARELKAELSQESVTVESNDGIEFI